MYFESRFIGSSSSTSISSMPPCSSSSSKSRGLCVYCALSIFPFWQISVGIFCSDCLTGTCCSFLCFLSATKGLGLGDFSSVFRNPTGTEGIASIEGVSLEDVASIVGEVAVMFAINVLRKYSGTLANPSLEKSSSQSGSDIQFIFWCNTRQKILKLILNMQSVLMQSRIPYLYVNSNLNPTVPSKFLSLIHLLR